MNWKFWTYTKQIRVLKADNTQFRKWIEMWEEKSKRTECDLAECAEMKLHLATLTARAPPVWTSAEKQRDDLQRKLIIAAVADEDPVWQTILSYADENERQEVNAALSPNLTADQRHFNSGRAANASDFAAFLRDVKYQASRELRKEKTA